MAGGASQALHSAPRQTWGHVWFRPQEEMYIFMEYCDEGTLEEVSRLGLQEHVIRLYSKQIAVAINVLHEHGIVHRDIKGDPHTPPPASAAAVPGTGWLPSLLQKDAALL